MHRSKKNVFNVLFWNANGISPRISELRNYVNENNIDALLIQETKIRENKYLNIANYNSYHTFSSASQTGRCPHGGTAIYIKRNIPHDEINNLNLQGIENTSIKIKINNADPFILTSTYVKNMSRINVAAGLELLFSRHPNTILAGDFNAHHQRWGCRRANIRGTQINRLLNTTNTDIIMPPSPTCFSSGNGTFIDFVLTRNINYAHTINTLDEFDSDHLPVLVTFDLNTPLPASLGQARVNWNLFKTTLFEPHLAIPNIMSTADIDSATHTLTTEIKRALASSTTHRESAKPPTLSFHVRQLVRQRNNMRKTWQSNRDPNLKRELNRLTRKVRQKIVTEKQQQYKELIESLNPEDTSIWEFAKKLRKPYGKLPPLKDSNKIAYSDEEKAEALANHYETQFEPNHDLMCQDTLRLVSQTLNNFRNTPVTAEINPASPQEIVDIIKNLKHRKSPGHDNIRNVAAKNLPLNIIFFITLLINKILKLNYFPKEWKNAIIIPIRKVGEDATIPANYRPISLLPTLSKITEKIILKRLNVHLSENDVIIPEQFGFRPKHSTTHQLLRVVEYISSGLNNKTPTAAIFLDIQKAFDKVWHCGLAYKLITLKVPDALVKLLISYLNDRHFQVRVKDKLSTPKLIKSSVPQGSILGPTLFNIYLNDIPRSQDTELALYADDSAILAKNTYFSVMHKQLQQHLDILQTWLEKWRIKLNPNKCHWINFSRKLKPPPPLYINNQAIHAEKSTKYLGVTLDSHLTWKLHITNVIKKAHMAVGALYPMIGNGNLSYQNKLLIYKSVIRPGMLYAAPVWGYACKSTIDCLEIRQNKTLRCIRKAPRYLKNSVIRKDFKIKTMRFVIKKQALNFFNNLPSVPNELLFNLQDYDHRKAKSRKRPRAVLNLETEN